MQRRFMEVDVFTAVPYLGNPLAVVLDGAGLSHAEMQRFANWTNFSETTFIVPPTDPTADYSVRIFTTTTELPFAGHPTLGSCHAWLAAGGVPQRSDRIVQQCGVGLVEISRGDSGRLAFAAPPMLRHEPVTPDVLDQLTTALGVGSDEVVDAAWIDNGPGWVGVLLDSADRVLALRPADSPHKIGVIGPHPEGGPGAYEVRAFFPEHGTSFEDPVTGSLNASAAQWLVASGRVLAPYVARQGSALGRDGIVRVDADEHGQIWIGGDVVTCVDGTVDL